MKYLRDELKRNEGVIKDLIEEVKYRINKLYLQRNFGCRSHLNPSYNNNKDYIYLKINSNNNHNNHYNKMPNLKLKLKSLKMR